MNEAENEFQKNYEDLLNMKLDVTMKIQMSNALVERLKDPAQLLSFILAASFGNNRRLIINAKLSKITADKYHIVSELK